MAATRAAPVTSRFIRRNPSEATILSSPHEEMARTDRRTFAIAARSYDLAKRTRGVVIVSGMQGVEIHASHVARDLQIGAAPGKAHTALLHDQQVCCEP